MDLADRLLRAIFTGAHHVLKAGWFVRRPRTFGAHALAFTPERKLVLVKLRYAPGWRLPGGGRRQSEDARDAVIRELPEQIGLTSHGAVRLACELDEATDFKHDLASLLIVEDVRYSPHRWSWEVEQICEAPLDDLPSGLSSRAANWIETTRGKL